MSVKSLAKELGVSEYALRKYAEEHKISKDTSNRGCYKFTQKDLDNIKAAYRKPKEETILYLLYRIYSASRRHYYIPAGFFASSDEALLKQFVAFQYSCANDYRKKCYNFYICTKRQTEIRMNKLKRKLGTSLFTKTTQALIPHFITSEKLPELIANKEIIKMIDFVPKDAREKLISPKVSFDTVSFEDLTDSDFLNLYEE